MGFIPRISCALAVVAVAALATLTTTATAIAAAPDASAQQQQSAAVSAALQQEAGVTPSEVTPTPLCSAPQPGTAACDAVALEADGSFVHPAAAAQQPPLRSASSAGPAFAGGSLAIGPDDTASPDAEPGSTSEPTTGTPAWLQQAYDTTWLSANRGSGDTIAIVDAYDDPTAAADLATYRSANGLPACAVAGGCLTILNQHGQTRSQAGSWPSANASWEGEETLDLDAVSALCPNCHIVLVEANSNSLSNFASAEVAAAAFPGVDQISNSWGSTVVGTPSASQFTFSGISVLAASGDNGYELDGGPQYPAAFAGVTAVGGTSLTTGSDDPRGFTETAWSDAGSSCATQVAQPAWQSGQACTGRATSDLAADADPDTGLRTYGTAQGGWALFGGTSLSTPLAAAFEALTQITGAGSPRWAYTDAGELNDITAGNNDSVAEDGGGTCAPTLAYLCDAGSGFDGPTGNGSIAGDVANGGPGIGGPDACAPDSCGLSGAGYATATTAAGAQLQAQIYPNGLETSYHWEYGTSTAFGAQTATATIAASSAPTTTQTALTGLAATTTYYYYRLVASNADGTTYGYTFSFTTATPTGPASNVTSPLSSSPSIGGGTQTGSDSPAPAAAPGTGSGSNTTTTTVSTTTTTTAVAASQSGAIAGAGSTKPSAATSAPGTGPIALLLGGGAARALVGDVLTAALPAGTHPAAAAITQFLRCQSSCHTVRSSGARYTLTAADGGALIRVRYTPNWGGDFSSAYVGPVLTPTTAGAMLDSGHAATLHTSQGTVLATTQTSSAHGHGSNYTTAVTIARAPHVTGTLHAWICPTALTAQGHPRPCTAPTVLRQRATLRSTAAGPFAVVVQR